MAQFPLIVGRLVIRQRLHRVAHREGRREGRYDERHGRLWSLVDEPAAIALANSRSYVELLKLRDLPRRREQLPAGRVATGLDGRR